MVLVHLGHLALAMQEYADARLLLQESVAVLRAWRG
jgi:hypothetical protein